MSNYTGLKPLKFLLLSLALTGAAFAADETYPVKVPASEPPAAEASSASAAPADTAPAEAASAAPAAEESKPAPVLRDSAPLRYIVKKGDTLWDIAGHFLQNPWQWPEIWYGNDQIKNPHRIYPGNVLRLVMINGRPRLMLGDAVATSGGPVKLSPRIRESGLDSAIPTIPMEAIRDFLNAPHIITEDQLDGTPYILDFTDNHIVGGATNQIFVKNLTERKNNFYSVVRKGDAYRDPDNNQVLGYEAVPVGTAEAERHGNACASATTSHPDKSCGDAVTGVATLINTTREARIGDHLIPPDEEPFDAFFYPRAPERNVKGRIISVFDGASQIGQYQIVALNRGAEDGLAPGHVLTVMQTGRTARDPESWFGSTIQLPDTEAGTVMVFKVMPRFSYALVMDATRAIHAKDGVVKPR